VGFDNKWLSYPNCNLDALFSEGQPGTLTLAEYTKRADLTGAPPHQGVSGTKLTQNTKGQVSGLST
jgi:hypothetical protein